MSSSHDAVFVSRGLAEGAAALVRAYRRGTLGGTTGNPPPPRQTSFEGPLRGILLADCPDNGTADFAVTELAADTTIQKVSLLGGPILGGTFTLSFKGQTTIAIPWNAAPEIVQTALASLLTIGPNNVEVSLGGQAYVNNDAGSTAIEFPGVWLVSLVGQFAGRTDTPLLAVDATNIQVGTGAPDGIVVATESWIDTGAVATARCLIPVGTPTPLRAGAVIVVLNFSGYCYGIIAAEPRQYFSPYYYTTTGSGTGGSGSGGTGGSGGGGGLGTGA